MKNKFISFICCLGLILTGCAGSKSDNATAKVPITLIEQIPQAVVGEAYDLNTLVTAQEGISYEFTAGYTDPETQENTQLNVRKGKITPRAEADIIVTVTAKRGKDSSSVQCTIPIRLSVDIMDQLLANQEIPNVTKQISKDSGFLFGENSTSSLHIQFPGGSSTPVLNLSDYALQAYYTAQVWENTAVTMQVYNPMEADVTLQLTGSSTTQTAKAGAWSNIVFSLYDMGITKPVVDSALIEEDPQLQLFAICEGAEQCNMYIDGLDIVHAQDVEGLQTGYVDATAPEGDFSDLLTRCKVYTQDPGMKLSTSTKGNGSNDAYCFGADQPMGYPTLYLDFPRTTDISGFDYLKLDVFAENAYPWVSVAVRFLDEEGQIQKRGATYDFPRDQWRTLYLNLDYLDDIDLTKAVGISVTLNLDSHFQENLFNCVYFDNISLYEYPQSEPQMSPALVEDNDIISGTFYTTNTKPNISGVCKVATDETGTARSNSSLLFWTNNACGYPNVFATFMFDQEQDWSDKTILSFDTHQANAHYWMRFDILYLDEEGKQKELTWYNDSIFNHWLTTNAPLNWFSTEDKESPKPEHLQHVVGFRISVDMAVHVTDEVAQIFFDNFVLS